jgi:hypothetical protein
MLFFLFFLAFQVILLAAWVSGYLDPYQKHLHWVSILAYHSLFDINTFQSVRHRRLTHIVEQELLLTEDQNLSKIQDQLGNQLGDMFGKRGLGEGIGSVLDFL